MSLFDKVDDLPEDDTPRARRRRRDDEFDDFEEDDRPRRRRREDDYDDYEDDRPRRGRRDEKRGPKVIKGKTYTESMAGAFIVIGIGAFCGLITFGCLIAVFLSDSTLAALGSFLFFALLTAGGVGWGIYIAINNRKLIVGKNVLQLVEGKDKVIGHVPYTNIARFQTVKAYDEEDEIADFYFVLYLKDRKSKDTFWNHKYSREEDFDIHVNKDVIVNSNELASVLDKAMKKAANAAQRG